MLPPRLPKKPKRETRWRSPAHTAFVRGHACCRCGATSGIEAAHVRLGSHTGMGQKPDDWRTVSLCKDCHDTQHRGEATFWRGIKQATGEDADSLIRAFIAASPKRREIELVMKERANG